MGTKQKSEKSHILPLTNHIPVVRGSAFAAGLKSDRSIFKLDRPPPDCDQSLGRSNPELRLVSVTLDHETVPKSDIWEVLIIHDCLGGHCQLSTNQRLNTPLVGLAGFLKFL